MSSVTEGDVVALPRLRCEVAQNAERLWHDVIKNRLLLWADHRLDKWLRDAAALRNFAEGVRDVCRDVRGFSGAGLIPQLSPLATLQPEERRSLVAKLGDAFEEQFRPDDVAGRLADRLDRLLDAVAGLTPYDNGRSDETNALNSVRAAARSLGSELQVLPRGFWLPRELVNTSETRMS